MTYTPLRMCVACRERRSPKELIRIACDKDSNAITVDTFGKMPGRGAYICRDEKCIAKARKKHTLERQLGCAGEDEIYIRLGEML